jgi:hypothetical protein
LLSGRDASETALKQVHSPSILHIASDGSFLQDQSEQKVRGALLCFRRTPHWRHRIPILAASNPAKADESSLAFLSGEDPLLRSGLAFACANSPCGGPDDGTLTAFEAATLDLRNTSLVVLSACDTGWAMFKTATVSMVCGAVLSSPGREIR